MTVKQALYFEVDRCAKQGRSAGEGVVFGLEFGKGDEEEDPRAEPTHTVCSLAHLAGFQPRNWYGSQALQQRCGQD